MADLDLEQLAPERPRPIARREYERMLDAGLFAGERVELLGGVIVEMSPQGALHLEVVKRLVYRLLPALIGRAEVLAHSPLALTEDSVPEPDVLVVPPADYSRGLPERALLVVEVSQASLRKDRGLKAALYAAHGVPEYWLVNLVDGVIEVHTDPAPAGYRQVVHLGRGEVLAPRCFPDVQIGVDAVLPPL